MKQVHDTTNVREGLSPFGSHFSMIVDEETSKLLETDKYAVLKDEAGLYLTERRNINSGTTDPYRIASIEWREDFLMRICVAAK